MKLAFRNQNRNQKPQNRKRAFQACLLVDDLVYKGVNRAAERIEANTKLLTKDRFVLTKRKLAFSSMTVAFSAYAVTKGGLDPMDVLGISMFAVALDDATKLITTSGSMARGFYEQLFKLVRFPALVAAACAFTELFMLEKNEPLEYLSKGAFVITLYLASSSNGMLDKVKKFLKTLKEKVTSAFLPTPVPVNESAE